MTPVTAPSAERLQAAARPSMACLHDADSPIGNYLITSLSDAYGRPMIIPSNICLPGWKIVAVGNWYQRVPSTPFFSALTEARKLSAFEILVYLCLNSL